MTQLKYKYHRLLEFYRKELWEAQPVWYLQWVCSFLRQLILTSRRYIHERMAYRASALTYSTIFAIVPCLAIAFAIAKGFGLRGLLEQWIRDSFVAQPEVIDTLLGFVNSYISHTNGGIFLGFGLLLLLWTLLNLTSNIENAFNQIWQVQRPRSVFRKVTDYTAVFFLLPVFAVVILGLSIYIYSFLGSLPADRQVLKPAALLMMKVLPLLLIWLFFTGLFMFMPNTKVKFSSAAMAALPTSLAFQLLQYGYVHSQMWLTSYNAIYGSFAALPLFMFMSQIAWMITLYGSTLAYIDQNIQNFYYGEEYLTISRRYHDYLCILLTASVCRRFAAQQPPATMNDLASENMLHIRLVNDIIYELCKIGILIEVVNDEKDEDSAYLPAYDIGQMTMATIIKALDKYDEGFDIPEDAEAWGIYCKQRDCMYAAPFWHTPLHLTDMQLMHIPEEAHDRKQGSEDFRKNHG